MLGVEINWYEERGKFVEKELHVKFYFYPF